MTTLRSGWVLALMTAVSMMGAGASLWACSGGGSQGAAPEAGVADTGTGDTTTGSGVTSQVVGPAGGTVTTPDGVTVDIPAGALSSDVTITVQQNSAVPAPANTDVVGVPVQLGPEGTQFALPVTLTVPLTPSALPAGKSLADVVIYSAPVNSTAFTALPTTVIGNDHIAAKTTHFSWFPCGVPRQFAPDGGLEGGYVPDASGDAPQDCSAQWATMLAAPIVPPTQYAGLDLGKGSNPAGLTVDEANATLGCGVPVSATFHPGFREFAWGPGQDVDVVYNLESHVIVQLALKGAYAGSAVAQAPDGGDKFAIRIGSFVDTAPDGGASPVSIQWSQKPNPELNAIFNAYVGTFDPSFGAVTDCQQGVPQFPHGACAVLSTPTTTTFGVRPITFYPEFNKGTSVPVGFYTFHGRGVSSPGCTTPIAMAEYVEYDPITPPTHIGGLDLNAASAVDGGVAGLTLAAANAADCSSTPATAVDPGYDAYAINGGDVLAEFNHATGIVYAVYVQKAWKGELDFQDMAGAHNYAIALGGIKKDSAAFAIDWTTQASAAASVTELFNALSASFLGGTPETDCTASVDGGAPDCVVSAGDAGATSIFMPALQLMITLPAGTSAPSSMRLTWPAGQ